MRFVIGAMGFIQGDLNSYQACQIPVSYTSDLKFKISRLATTMPRIPWKCQHEGQTSPCVAGMLRLWRQDVVCLYSRPTEPEVSLLEIFPMMQWECASRYRCCPDAGAAAGGAACASGGCGPSTFTRAW